MAALDAEAFGARRDALLAYLQGCLPGCAFLAESEGRVAGFVLGRPGRVSESRTTRRSVGRVACFGQRLIVRAPESLVRYGPYSSRSWIKMWTTSMTADYRVEQPHRVFLAASGGTAATTTFRYSWPANHPIRATPAE